MKAIVYEITVSEGIIASIHGMCSNIAEIHIPSLNIAFNMGDGEVHYFRAHEDRYNSATKIQTIEVPDDMAKDLEEALLSRETTEKQIKKWMEAEGIH